MLTKCLTMPPLFRWSHSSKQRRLIVRLQPAEHVHLASGARGLNGIIVTLELFRGGGWSRRFDLSAPIHRVGRIDRCLVECEREGVTRGWLTPTILTMSRARDAP